MYSKYTNLTFKYLNKYNNHCPAAVKEKITVIKVNVLLLLFDKERGQN
jgi:hypothetical protein